MRLMVRQSFNLLGSCKSNIGAMKRPGGLSSDFPCYRVMVASGLKEVVEIMKPSCLLPTVQAYESNVMI